MLSRKLLPALIAVLVVLGLTALRVADPFPVVVLREIAFDFYQRLSPRPPVPDAPVRVIDIDEASLGQFGQWPWPRDRLATLTERLTELGAAVIGYDVLFPEPDRMSPSRIAAELPGVDAATLPDYDAVFATALATSPSILGFSTSPGARPLTGTPKGGFAVSGPDPRDGIPYVGGAAVPLPALREAASGIAALSLNARLSTSAVRRIPTLWTNGNALFPALSVESLRLALGLQTIVVLGDTAARGYVDGLRIGPLDVPTLSNGDLWVYYSRPREDLLVSAKDVLSPGYGQLRPRIEGHIVLIGTSASGLLDLHNTTLGDNVPGVTIHAQAIEQILAQSFLTRPDWIEGLEWVGFLLVAILLVLVVLALGPLAGLFAGGMALAGAIGFSWWMFTTQGIMLDPSFPLVGLTLSYGAVVFLRFATTDRDRRQLRRAFGYYVAPQLLTEIENSGDSLKLGGETRDVTVMFTDMRGFTSLSEKLQPQEILGVLNTLFGALGAEIVERFGTIDKFIGDAIMAFWNAPVDVPSHQQRAIDAALAMRLRLRQLNEANAFGLKGRGTVEALGIGIGIASGEALVGNMGLETRFDYSALGDTVNTASRVESACKEVGYDILISGPAHAAAGADFATLEAGALALKGKAERLPIHIVVGDAALATTGAFRLLRTTHADALRMLAAGEDARGAIAECIALAPQVEPGLRHFYELLDGRRADFKLLQRAAE